MQPERPQKGRETKTIHMSLPLTVEDLDKLGIYNLGYKLHPRRFFVPHVGEVDLHEPYRIEDIFEKIHNSGERDGIKRGMEQKINEIKNCLNIY